MTDLAQEVAIYREAARQIADGEQNQICYALASAFEAAKFEDKAMWKKINQRADYFISQDGWTLRGWNFGMPEVPNGRFPADAQQHRVLALLCLTRTASTARRRRCLPTKNRSRSSDPTTA